MKSISLESPSRWWIFSYLDSNSCWQLPRISVTCPTPRQGTNYNGIFLTLISLGILQFLDGRKIKYNQEFIYWIALD